MSSRNTFWAVTALAFCLRAMVLVSVGPNPLFAIVSDSTGYTQPAQNLLTHGTFAITENGQLMPELYRTPGYPVFLVPFLSRDGHVRHRALQWVQAALNALSAGLVYLAALLFWSKPRAAVLAGLGMALDYVNAIHCLFILADILFVFLLSLVLWFLAQSRFHRAGFTAALAAFVKPIGLYYPAVLGLFLLWKWIRDKRPLSPKGLAIFVTVSFLPLMLWMQRNHRLTGQWTFTTIQGDNLYVVRAAMVEMERSHLPYEAAMEDVRKQYAAASDGQSTSRWAAHFLWSHRTDLVKVMAKDLVRLLAGNSVKIVAWTILKDDHYDPSTMPYIPSQSSWEQAKELIGRHPALGIGLVLYLLFLGTAYVLAGTGLWAASRQVGWASTWVLASSIFYFAFLSLGVSAQARYRLPIMPAVFFFAGGGCQALFFKRDGH